MRAKPAIEAGLAEKAKSSSRAGVRSTNNEAWGAIPVKFADFDKYIYGSGLEAAVLKLRAKGYAVKPSRKNESQFRVATDRVPSTVWISIDQINDLRQRHDLRNLPLDLSDYDLFCNILSHELGHASEHAIDGDWMDELLAWDCAERLFEKGISNNWHQLKEYALTSQGYKWNIKRHDFNDSELSALRQGIDHCPFCDPHKANLAYFPDATCGIIDLWIVCLNCEQQYRLRFKNEALYKAFRIDSADFLSHGSFGICPSNATNPRPFRLSDEVAMLFRKQRRWRCSLMPTTRSITPNKRP